MSTSLAPHLTAFLREHLPSVRRVSPHTCESYAYAFRLLLEFASQRLKVSPSAISLELLDAPLLLDFLTHIETERKNGASSRNARLAAIKSFFRFLQYRVPSALEQVQRILAIPFKRTVRREVAYLQREEMQAIIDATDLASRIGIRDRAMLYLTYAAGLRVSELVGLRLEDLTFQPRPAILVRGKGRRERTLPLWKEAAAAVRRWLSVRGAAPVPEMFVNARGGAMTRAGFEYVLAKHVAIAATRVPSLLGKRVSPHVLRHTCAMIALRGTRDIRKVALWLGHASPTTTEIYLHADASEKIAAIDAVTPLHLRRGRFKLPDRLIAALQPSSSRRYYAE
jgi:site-specific recombinase XerD